MNLGGAPTSGKALIQAARLGLELENDIRVSAERLSQLRHPLIPVRFHPPPIPETIAFPDPPTRKSPPLTPRRSIYSIPPPQSEDDPDDPLKGMPLL